MEKTTATGGAPAEHERAGWMPRTPGQGEAVLMVDVEQFKAIRGQYGGRTADSVTRLVVDLLRRVLRQDDRLACVRDDEFMAVLSGAAAPTLPGIEVRVRAALHRLRVVVHGEIWTLSCALGAAARPRHAAPLERVVQAADHALWRAKRDERLAG